MLQRSPAPAITLYPYQAKLVDELRQSYRDDKMPCLVLPTGGGKTVVLSALAHSSQGRNRRVWFVCHRDFLVTQTSGTFTLMGVDHGILAATAKGRTVWKPTMVVSIDTLRSRLAQVPQSERPDVIAWDECHHLASASWSKVWQWAGDECFHMGLTATPVRLDGRGLAPVEEGAPGFTKMILGPSTGELMEMGFLSRYRAFAPSKVDLSGVRKTAGEYNLGELNAAMTKQAITGDIIGHYRRLAMGKRMIYFCVSVEYSKHLAQAFTAAGIPAMHVDAETSADDRIRAARLFAADRVKILTNVGLFGEGYDLAAQAGEPVTVEGVGLVRPTMSLSLAIQQMGRCLRRKDYPGLILDHANIIEQHGLPDTEREWTLAGKKKKPAEAAQVKTCPACLAQLKVAARTCDNCGHVFVTKPRHVEHVDGELTEIDPKRFHELRKPTNWNKIVGACKTYADFVRAAKVLGYKGGWAHFAWKEFKDHGYVSRRGRF